MKKFLAVLAVVAIVAFAAPAFAANPFMDVPAGHWAYDAVAQLAASGVVSGYPDGAFKGAQPATRYEVASVVARALAKVDAEKASKQDLEMLKKLVMEFKDELDALGVKVDKIDKRVAVLEDGIGGWKIRGAFRFDASFGGGDNQTLGGNGGASYNEGIYSREFRKEQIRLFITKQIDENTSFYMQWRSGSHASGVTGVGDTFFNMRRVYVDMKLPYDIAFRVGRFFYDPEGEHGLYVDNDATFGDYRMDGFQARKTWGNLTGTAWIGRNTQFENGHANTVYEKIAEFDPDAKALRKIAQGEAMNYAVDLFWQPNEKFFGGVTGNWLVGDAGLADAYSAKIYTYDLYASFNFTPAVKLQGMYYWQKLNGERDGLVIDNDAPKAWKAILNFDQSLLKFTSLRFEYQEQDNTFVGPRNPYSYGYDNSHAATIAANMPIYGDGKTKFLFIKAEQKWNDKWSTYLRYGQADFNTGNISPNELRVDKAYNYGVGVQYQYTPAVAFGLAYDYVKYGDNNEKWTVVDGKDVNQAYNGNEHVIRFRTSVTF